MKSPPGSLRYCHLSRQLYQPFAGTIRRENENRR